MKNVLIVGGSSGLSNIIVSTLENNGYQIDSMTYRNKNKTYGSYNWIYLDLEDFESVKIFIDQLKTNYYSKIILLPGNTLGNYPDFKNIPENIVRNFYNAYLFNYNWLVINLLKSLSNEGQIISISSMAANKPIRDANYSAVKAGVQAFIMSLSVSLNKDQSAFSISPGLIYDTKAFYDSNYKEDISSLATKEQIANIILNADKSFNGKVIEIGY
jgi:NAD(P)-dependent dehydrogenase (short-subunit alcohol dehydrogenase family)